MILFRPHEKVFKEATSCLHIPPCSLPDSSKHVRRILAAVPAAGRGTLKVECKQNPGPTGSQLSREIRRRLDKRSAMLV